MPEARLDQYVDELAVELGPEAGEEYDRDTLAGLQHRGRGSDLLIAGRYGDLIGDRSVLFSLDNQIHAVEGTGKFWVFGDLILNGQLFTGSGLPQPGTGQQTFLISGGQVTHQTGYEFLVSSATYRIDGEEFTSPQTTVELDPADATLDRIDVIAVDNTGQVVVITGTPAATPSEPTIDPSIYLKLALVFVPAASSAPPGVSSADLYTENAGGPGEWNWSTSGSGWTLGSTAAPRTGTKNIEATAITNNAYIQGQTPSGTINPNSSDLLALYIRSKANWGNNRTLVIRWYNGGAAVGVGITIATGAYGFNSANTTAYQQIAIPISQFAIPSGTLVNQLRITHLGGAIGFYLDDIAIQGGSTSGGGSSGGMTQAEADARYAQAAFKTIAVAGESDVVADAIADTLTLVEGANITITTTPGTDSITIAAAGGGGGNAFGTIAVAGETDVVADAANDTLELVAGAGVILTTVPASDQVQIEADPDQQFDHVGIGTAPDATARLVVDGQIGSLTFDAGTSGTSKTIDWNDGNTQLLSMTGNCVLTLSNPIDGGRYLLLLEQSSGGHTMTWPSSVKWKGGTAPTLTATAAHLDLVTLVWVAGLGASGNYLANFNLDYTPA